jgi:hypothetical protein
MARWQDVETYLNTLKANESFTSRDYASYAGVSWAEASQCIQSYLGAQRSPRSRTKYVIKRSVGCRTSSAKWLVGQKSKDVRSRGLTFSSDVKNNARRAFEPDVRRIASINPGAARHAERVIDATLEGAMKVLEAAVRT